MCRDVEARSIHGCEFSIVPAQTLMSNVCRPGLRVTVSSVTAPGASTGRVVGEL